MLLINHIFLILVALISLISAPPVLDSEGNEIHIIVIDGESDQNEQGPSSRSPVKKVLKQPILPEPEQPAWQKYFSNFHALDREPLPLPIPKRKKAIPVGAKPSGVKVGSIDTRSTALKDTVLVTSALPAALSQTVVPEFVSINEDEAQVQVEQQPEKISWLGRLAYPFTAKKPSERLQEFDPSKHLSHSPNAPTETYVPHVVIDIVDDTSSEVKIDEAEPNASHTSNEPTETHIPHVVIDIAESSANKRYAAESAQEKFKKFGAEFKNYEIVKKLGEGTFSEVYLAEKRLKTPRSSHPSVALKICPNSQRKVAVKEVEILRRISPHPNIIRLIGTTRSNLHFVMVLEYIPGGDLFDLINDHHGMLIANDFHFVKLIFKQILEAVLHIHNKGVVHRDLKPENILVCFDPKNPPSNDYSYLVKLTDFGLSHDVNISPIPRSGSLPYTSPEIIRNKLSGIDPRKIDVWALGVILFRLIEGQGRLPFDADTRKEEFYKINRGIYSFKGFVPETARALVSKMLTGNWRNRAGVQELIEDDWLKN